MATRLVRMPDSDSIQFGAPGEMTNFVETFLYTYDDAAIKTVLSVANDSLVPKQGDRYAQFATGAPPQGLLASFIARSVDISPVPQTPRAWIIKVTWGSRFWNANNRPYFNITRSTSQRTVAMYRSGAAIFTGVPADGTMPFPPTGFLSGTAVDMNGQPLVVKISQQSIQVDFLWDRTKDKSTDTMSGAATSPDPPSEWSSVYVNTRNNAPFLGWKAGYLTYLGWTANESPDETLVISHRFLADDWQHLEQRVAPNTGGKPLLTTGPTLVNIPTQSCAYVYWYQPFVALTPFDNLLSWRTNLLETINTALPTYP